MKKKVKYPCQNCIYFKVCGENTRTMPCDGRKTKSEERNGKKYDKRKSNTDFGLTFML